MINIKTLHAEKRFEITGTFKFYTTRKTAKEAEKTLKMLEFDVNKNLLISKIDIKNRPLTPKGEVIKMDIDQVTKLLF